MSQYTHCGRIVAYAIMCAKLSLDTRVGFPNYNDGIAQDTGITTFRGRSSLVIGSLSVFCRGSCISEMLTVVKQAAVLASG